MYSYLFDPNIPDHHNVGTLNPSLSNHPLVLHVLPTVLVPCSGNLGEK
jgi:hypothetical protein